MPLDLEKGADGAREGLGLVCWNGVPRARDLHEAAVRQRVDHALGDVGGEDVALGTTYEQRRRCNPAERLPEVARVPPSALSHHVAKRLVILPLEAAPGKRATPVAHAVAQALLGHARVGPAHELDGLLLRFYPLGRSRHHLPDALHPWQVDLGTDVHDAEPLDPRGVAASRVGDADTAAHGEPDQGEALETERLHEPLDVAGHRRDAVVTVPGAVAVAVAALVEGDDADMGGEITRQRVPRAGVARDAVEEDHGRRGLRAPRDIVKDEAADRQRVIDRGDHRPPHTSRASPTQRESFARSSSTVTSLPSTVEEK